MDRDSVLYELERDILNQRKNEHLDMDVIAVELLARSRLADLGDDYLAALSFEDIKEIGSDYENNRNINNMEINEAVIKIQDKAEDFFTNVADRFYDMEPEYD